MLTLRLLAGLGLRGCYTLLLRMAFIITGIDSALGDLSGHRLRGALHPSMGLPQCEVGVHSVHRAFDGLHPVSAPSAHIAGLTLIVSVISMALHACSKSSLSYPPFLNLPALRRLLFSLNTPPSPPLLLASSMLLAAALQPDGLPLNITPKIL